MTAKEKILSLTAAANTATGKADADLTAAMASLIDGYGQSGGIEPIKKKLGYSQSASASIFGLGVTKSV